MKLKTRMKLNKAKKHKGKILGGAALVAGATAAFFSRKQIMKFFKH